MTLLCDDGGSWAPHPLHLADAQAFWEKGVRVRAYGVGFGDSGLAPKALIGLIQEADVKGLEFEA